MDFSPKHVDRVLIPGLNTLIRWTTSSSLKISPVSPRSIYPVPTTIASSTRIQKIELHHEINVSNASPRRVANASPIPSKASNKGLNSFNPSINYSILKSNNDKYRFLNLFCFVFQALMRHVMTTGSLKDAIERNREENVGRRGLLKIAKRHVVFAQVTNE